MNKRNSNLGYQGDSVGDLIDDAAQILWKMDEGVYYDELGNTVMITKSAGVTKMEIISREDLRFVIECIEEDGMGKIVKITGQRQGETKDFYWSTRFMTFNRCIMGERGKLMMRSLIEKLKLRNAPPESRSIQSNTRCAIVEATSLFAASEHPMY